MAPPRSTSSWMHGDASTYNRSPTSDPIIAPSFRKRNALREKLLLTASILVLLATTIFLVVKLVHLRVYNPMDDYQILNPFPVLYDQSNTPQSDPNASAVVSTLYSNNYAISTAVLAHSVRSVNSTARLILLYIDGQVSEEALCISRASGWELLAVPRIAPPNGGEGVYYRFVDQYTKLNLWGLDKHGIDRLVYLDADTLVRRNFDELFNLPFSFAAVPDVYGPGNPQGFRLGFNAGVMAIRTSSSVLRDMKNNIETARYPIGQAEQAFLNLYYGVKAMRLPYIYNALISIKKRNRVLWEDLKSHMSVIHYTERKPFMLEAQPGERILTPEETETAIDIAQRDFERWEEEFGWWRAAYHSMMAKHGAEVKRCTL
ncbi:hypothetical protein CCMSSC00406_0007806 [Pleurotus cornucopiae]|uniref:Uncharacterized protein n=1 Tax=Pleurotus cornucopiae TaxID=5321 RepID=A0ACB7J742_PLECO|nr:hypothetical protein CCMSSC00406_0007806 [Pleurotus cornucopiae]